MTDKPEQARLLPCAHCAAPGYLLVDRRTGVFKIKCTGCEIQTRRTIQRNEAITAWNRRQVGLREAFERGFVSAFSEATVALNCSPPFELTEAVIEKAWQNRNEGYDEPLGAAPDSLRTEGGKQSSHTEASPQEPVAWRWRYLHPNRPNKWAFCQSPRQSYPATSEFVGIEAEPLYAAPQPDGKLRYSDGVLEAVQRLLERGKAFVDSDGYLKLVEVDAQPDDRAALIEALEKLPDIMHARLVPLEQRETEYVLPASLKSRLIAALAAAKSADTKGGEK